MKVPTKHGLDRKFKPWRKGKSSNSNKRSSLKQQLRGHERLLAKLQKGDEPVDEKTKELRGKIAALKQEISQKQQSMVEKKHAEKAHGQRFLDRQRLVRSAKKVRKSESNSKEEELFKISLDQVYVAHHPNDIKYMPLFKHGKRVVDQSRQLFRRALTRKRILSNIGAVTRVNWIDADQYKRLPKNEWTIQDEERIFGGSISRSAKDTTKSNKPEDSRFALASTHEALLKAAEQAETELLADQDEKVIDSKDIIQKAKSSSKKDSSSSSSSDSSSDSEDEEADPLTSKESAKSTPKESAKSVPQKDQKDYSNSSSDSDSSSSSSDDSDEEADAAKPPASKTNTVKDSDSSSSSDSDTSSDSSEDEDEVKPQIPAVAPIEEDEESVDNFLIDATDNDDVFDKPAVQMPALSTVRGDKSKGFETQSQRPGEYRKKRIRQRY